MTILDLPPEIFAHAISTILVCNGAFDVLNLRLVCKTFNVQVIRSLYGTKIDDILDPEPEYQQKPIALFLAKDFPLKTHHGPPTSLTHPDLGTNTFAESIMEIYRFQPPSADGDSPQRPVTKWTKIFSEILHSLFRCRPSLEGRKEELLFRLATMISYSHGSPSLEHRRHVSCCHTPSIGPLNSYKGVFDEYDEQDVFHWDPMKEVLRLAASLGMLDLILELAEFGYTYDAKFESFNEDGYVPCALSCAVRYNHPEVFEHLFTRLLDDSKHISSHTAEHCPLRCALYTAAAVNNSQLVFRVLSMRKVKDGPLSYRQLLRVNYEELLKFATIGGSPDLIQRLLEWGDRRRFSMNNKLCDKGNKLYPLNRQPRRGLAWALDHILINACQAGNLPVVKFALTGIQGVAAQPDIKVRVSSMDMAPAGIHQTPLMYACRYGYLPIVAILIKHGAKIKARHHDFEPVFRDYKKFHNLYFPRSSLRHNRGALKQAVRNGWVDIARMLIESGAEPLDLSDMLETALTRTNVDMVEMLLEKMDLEENKSYWEHRMDLAFRQGRISMALRMRERGLNGAFTHELGLSGLANIQLC